MQSKESVDFFKNKKTSQLYIYIEGYSSKPVTRPLIQQALHYSRIPILKGNI
jgi:hypothetical protein